MLAALLAVPLILLLLGLRAAQGAGLPLFGDGGFGDGVPVLLPDPNLNVALWLILIYGPVYVVLWGWLTGVERRPLWTIGFESGGARQCYLRGLAVGAVLFSASVALLVLAGQVGFEVDPGRPTGLAHIGAVLIVAVGWLVQGAAEEALTRGFLLPTVAVRWGVVPGILLSSLVFAALHLLNPHLTPIGQLNLFLFGVFAALYALWEGSLWGVCAIHGAWNWVQSSVYGFAVSGQGQQTATLLDLREVGHDWMTGGAFGPEGGLAVTLVLLSGCALVWVAQSRARASLPFD